ncbi:hypothetical protein CDL15_Pgr020364 [Punica granatum]|uniref:Uncharacterized protein n=1 Tax=Punica granatum TaxID=22663 RepID=A0A218VV19_PUNGR|nr:hypothetical protein CDL15_Pgr020364 [Punica granatum]PKI56787.1 hypothetical protein CRG98_022848 [Punica granatum]
MSVFSVFSSVALLCSSLGSKARKSAKNGKKNSKKNKSSPPPPSSVLQRPNKKLVLKMNRNLSSKALLKMISWRKVHEDHYYDDCDQYDDDEEALWRKTIMKGEKCRPLDFTGKIVYDSDGNLLATS